MDSMSVVELFGDMPLRFVETLAGIFFIVLVGKFAGNESRLLMTATAAAVVYPHPATLFAVGLLGVLFRAFDIFNEVRGN